MQALKAVSPTTAKRGVVWLASRRLVGWLRRLAEASASGAPS